MYTPSANVTLGHLNITILNRAAEQVIVWVDNLGKEGVQSMLCYGGLETCSPRKIFTLILHALRLNVELSGATLNPSTHISEVEKSASAGAICGPFLLRWLKVSRAHWYAK